MTVKEQHPAECSGLCSLCCLLIFLRSLHSQQVLHNAPLICIVSGMLWPDELGADQGVVVTKPLLEGSGHICRIPTTLFRLFEEMLKLG